MNTEIRMKIEGVRLQEYDLYFYENLTFITKTFAFKHFYKHFL